jgi:uncharacterized membrane protein
MLETKSSRIESLDVLRGLVMVLMVLDHVRDYFHHDAFFFDPNDLEDTNPLLFFTRWITHFCAPAFVFLAGTSAFLMGEKLESKKELSKWLFTRGVWLIFLELTILKFAWSFQLNYHFTLLMVIWALGISMIFLAGLIHLHTNIILGIGLVIVCCHNLLDSVKPTGPVINGIWYVLHVHKRIKMGDYSVSVGYPILPWIGVMALGYCFGQLYTPSFDRLQRKRILIGMGLTLLFVFFLFRLTNLYGDLEPWSRQETGMLTFLSILNTTKYPPSLLFLCMTLGPCLLFLAFAERPLGNWSQQLIVIGRVPLFFYVLHIFVIHFLATWAALFTGYHLSDMVINRWITKQKSLKGFGFSLGTVYFIWMGIVVLLYPLCIWYEELKRKNPEKKYLKYL